MAKIIKKGNSEVLESSPQGIQNPEKGAIQGFIESLHPSNQIKNIQDFVEQGSRNVSQLGQGIAHGTATLLGLTGSGYNAVRSGVGGLASLAGQSNPLPENRILPTSGSLQKGVENIAQSILPESHLKPKGLVESFARNIGEFAPGVAATIASGGAALPTVIRGAQAAVGSTIGEKIFGPIGGIVGAITGPWAANKVTNLFNKAAAKGVDPKTLQGAAEQAQNFFYDMEKELGKNINVKVPHYENSLESIAKEVEKTISIKDSQKKDIINIISSLKGDIKDGSVNASKIAERNKEINSLFSEFTGNARPFIKRIQKEVLQTGDKIGGLDITPLPTKEWYNAWKSGNDVTKALNYKTALGEIFESSPKIGKYITNPILKGLLGGGGGYATLGYITPWGPVINTALGVTGTALAGKAAQLYGFARQPRAQHLLAQAAKYYAERNIPALLKTVKILNTSANSYQKKNPESSQKVAKIIRKGNPQSLSTANLNT